MRAKELLIEEIQKIENDVQYLPSDIEVKITNLWSSNH